MGKRIKYEGEEDAYKRIIGIVTNVTPITADSADIQKSYPFLHSSGVMPFATNEHRHSRPLPHSIYEYNYMQRIKNILLMKL